MYSKFWFRFPLYIPRLAGEGGFKGVRKKGWRKFGPIENVFINKYIKIGKASKIYLALNANRDTIIKIEFSEINYQTILPA
jgi:UDP-3-O-[3-hydroxymyristoyl] glucosamine N-acyltransferase